MAKHTVKQGECIDSIAFDNGFFWETLWKDSQNAELKQKRKDPNVLFPGDEVFIPDKREKNESGATEQKHRFKRKGVPSQISIVLKDEESKPRSGLDYVMEIDGKLFQGKTDSAGRIRQPIPPNAQRGKITIGSGDQIEEYPLQLGNLDPITEISGIQARLNNLGFPCGEPNGILNDATQQSLRRFQAECKISETGEPDNTTREKLKQEHGS